MEKLKPTEQRIGLSPIELKAVSELTERFVSDFKPAISLVLDQELRKKTGWRASWRNQAADSKWQWTGLDVGNLAVRQEGVLRGPKGERIMISSRYDPMSEDKSPDFFHLYFTNSNGQRFSMDINFKDYTIPSLHMMVEAKNSLFSCRLDYSGRKVTVMPRDIGGIALFFNGLDFEATDNGIIDLLKRKNLQVGEHAAIPDQYKASVDRPIDAVRWYMDQKYEGEKVGDVAKWIEGLPVTINLPQTLSLIEEEAKQVLQIILSVADNPSLGKVWTQKDDQEAFNKRLSDRKR